MNDQDNFEMLLNFFKALADEKRLMIIGLLAQKPTNVEQLAKSLNLSVSTTSHHLSKLAKVGLVTARAQGHYAIYSLQLETLKEMAKDMLHESSLTNLTQKMSEDAYEQKVLSTFLDSEGRIISFPAQEKKFLVILKYVVQFFKPEVRYSEKEVNEILSRYNSDTAMLRRYLVGYGLMDREGGGGCYWRLPVTS